MDSDMRKLRDPGSEPGDSRELRGRALSLCPNEEKSPFETPENAANEQLVPARRERLPLRACIARDAREIKEKIVGFPAWVRESAPGWFDFRKPDTSENRKTFPVSAFAAMAAVAVSLMLIVASSVMISRAERRVSDLNYEIKALDKEVTKLRSDLDMRNDMLEIREIAVERFGMVSEEYLRSDYLLLEHEDRIEVYNGERERTVGLSALLSAIGIKK